MVPAKRDFLSELNDIDWDFNGERATSSTTHWYPARFVPQVPGILVGFFTNPGQVVLDPFCGSGTSLVEARRLGRDSVGVDTNRVAVLISESRLAWMDPQEFSECARKLRDRAVNRVMLGMDLDQIPNLNENRFWYEPDTLAELAAIWESIEGPPEFRQIALGVFSGILRHVSSQDKHWGWICDNVRPTEYIYKPALEVFMTRIGAQQRRLESVQGMSSARGLRSEVVLGDCRSVLGNMERASIDAIVTSPPYFGMTDYVRSQRLTYLWFGWSLDDDRRLETGARFKRRRASAHADYMSEMVTAFQEASRVLRPGGFCGIVAGESPDRQPYLQEFKSQLEERCEFKIQAVLHRTVAKQRALSSRRQTEEVIIARRA